MASQRAIVSLGTLSSQTIGTLVGIGANTDRSTLLVRSPDASTGCTWFVRGSFDGTNSERIAGVTGTSSATTTFLLQGVWVFLAPEISVYGTGSLIFELLPAW